MPPNVFYHGTTIPMDKLDIGLCPTTWTKEDIGRRRIAPADIIAFTSSFDTATAMAERARELQGVDFEALEASLKPRLASVPQFMAYLIDVTEKGYRAATTAFLEKGWVSPSAIIKDKAWRKHPERKLLEELGFDFEQLVDLAQASTGAADRMAWFEKYGLKSFDGRDVTSRMGLGADLQDFAMRLGVDCTPRVVEAEMDPAEPVVEVETMSEAIDAFRKGGRAVWASKAELMLVTDLDAVRLKLETYCPTLSANLRDLLKPKGLHRLLVVPADTHYDAVSQGDINVPWKPLTKQQMEQNMLPKTASLVVMLDAKHQPLRISLVENRSNQGQWSETPLLIELPTFPPPAPKVKAAPVVSAQLGLF